MEIKKDTKIEIKTTPKKDEFTTYYEKYIGNDVQKLVTYITDLFNNSYDVVVRTLVTNKGNVLIIYIDGLIDKDLLDRDVIKPLSIDSSEEKIIDIINVSQIKIFSINLNFIKEVLDGNVVLLSESSKDLIAINLKKWQHRSIEPPDSESVIRGPKESFIETIGVNTSLIRRKIKNPNLVFESITLGDQTNTTVSLCYLKNIVNEEILEELRKRLKKIDMSSTLESGYIEQYIEDRPTLPLPTVGSTQKPDVVAGKILEGRIAIICDGTPFVATVPFLFIENLQTSEDYYNRPYITSILRIIRMSALFISVLLPGGYVAIASYHQEMIPTTLLQLVASATNIVPFPKGAETLLMLFIFEILRESGIRLPRNIGSAISIVGAIVIGEIAVDAGIVGAPVVIVVALTALSSFILPNLTEFITFYRFVFLFLGSFMGLIGIGSGAMLVLAQLTSTESFGISYTTVFADNRKIRDFLFRSSLKKMNYRPDGISGSNSRRGGI